MLPKISRLKNSYKIKCWLFRKESSNLLRLHLVCLVGLLEARVRGNRLSLSIKYGSSWTRIKHCKVIKIWLERSVNQRRKKSRNLELVQGNKMIDLLMLVVYNKEMKRTNKTVIKAQHSAKSSDVSMDCSCQILYDTSLSNVSDGQCDCSDCLQANLNAFNQFKIEETKTHDTTKQNANNKRGKDTHSASKTQKQSRSKINRYKSTDHFTGHDKNTKKKWGIKQQNQEGQSDEFDEFQEGNQFTNGQLNDFLLITKNRTRKYLEQRKNLQQEQKHKRKELKQRIKKNLQLLKYTAGMINDQNSVRQGEPVKHPYKWNHSKYSCQCNGKVDQKQPNHHCCRKIKVKSELDTNLSKFKQNFTQNRNNILQQRKKRRESRLKQKESQKCPHDMCPDHHNKTNKQKIKQIEQLIQKNVKKYYDNKNKKKAQKQQKQKIIEGKLRAIDIKSKQILGRSKKVDDDISKTSFRLSIQQYDTFSELRQENQRRKKMKENERQVRRNLKNGGGNLQQKIYEIQQDEDEEQYKILKPENKLIASKTKAEAPQYRNHDQIYDRIAYDAQIITPKNLKNKAEQKDRKKQNNLKGKNDQAKKQQKKKNLSKGKEEERKKIIQKEIEKKKGQIMQQFQKRNSNKPLNYDLRKQYEQKMTKTKQKVNSIPSREQKQKNRDPYRQTYQTKAGKDINQINVHGDPLLQQYTHHNQKDKAKVKGQKETNMGIFRQNVHSLTSKQHLQP